MQMEKRALLAFVLSLLVLFGYQYMMTSKVQEQRESIPHVDKEVIQEEDLSKELVTDTSEEEIALPLKTPIDEIETDQVAEKFIIVDTELAQYRISTRNAVIKEIVLKKYKDETGNNIRLIPENLKIFPLQLYSEDKLFQLDFIPSQNELRIVNGKETGILEMFYQGPKGTQIEKIFEFRASSYEIIVKVRQNALSEYQLAVGSSFHRMGEKEKSRYYGHVGPILDQEGKIERIKYKDIKERMVLTGSIPWIAFEEKYFMTALLPETGVAVKAVAERLNEKSGSHVFFGMMGSGEDLTYRFFAGPKDYELLKSFGSGLDKVINFGVFSFLAKPMFYILKTFYRFFRNYGIAIILLTTVIKIIFWPLTHKQQKSMKDMQKIQPEMSAIREKFKQDPQRMNKEVMALYKQHKVNPAAGCLPLLIQIPVFFALYNVLLNAIELRGAPFLYIPDLSAADSLFGHIGGFAVGPLPLLMGLSMYVQQKMMPTAMDPKQAKIMQLLPVFLTVMFLNFPSGLVLYWLINNVLTIVQQYFINKKKGEVSA